MKSIIGIIINSFLLIAFVSCTDENEKSVVKLEPAIEVSETLEKDYLSLGKQIAKESFKKLSEQLKSKMIEGGPIKAIPFCHSNAMSISDSLGLSNNATVNRVAIKNRNPLNVAVGLDVEIMNNYQLKLNEKEPLQPELHHTGDNQVVFYAPILLKAQCVVCHGKPETEISVNTLAKIQELYPEDKATGFSEGDLRGLWKITFMKE